LKTRSVENTRPSVEIFEDDQQAICFDRETTAAPVANVIYTPKYSRTIECLDLTMSSPMEDMAYHETKSTNLPKSRQQEAVQVDLTLNNSPTTRRSPRIIAASNRPKGQTSPSLSKSISNQTGVRISLAPLVRGRQFLRVRDSLAGAFALEELDSPEAAKKAIKVWKMSDVKVLDLC
jgi:hypothetical protein